MSDDRRNYGLGSAPPRAPASDQPSPQRAGLRTSAPPSADGAAQEAGLRMRAPPTEATTVPRPPPATPPAREAALRGDSVGPLPQLSKLTEQRATQWISLQPLDHFTLLDIPKNPRMAVHLAEWQDRARKREEYFRHWSTQLQGPQSILGTQALNLAVTLQRDVASAESLANYIRRFGEETVRADAQRYFDPDQSIDAQEFQMLLRTGVHWEVPEPRVVAIVREVDPNFTPPRPEPPKPSTRGGAWTPLVGKFRTAPSSLDELHEAAVSEIPVAQELLASGLLAFHLSQQKESKLAKVAERVAAGYDRRESLLVWDFLWSTGYRTLHVIGLAPVDSLEALVAACAGRSAPLIDAVKSGQLSLWAERVVDAKDLARVARPDRNLDPHEQARRSLWLAGDRRMQLATGEVIASLADLEAAMLSSGAAAEAATREAVSGALFEWLRAVGETGLANSLPQLVRGQSPVYVRYLLIWASGRVRTLPLWRELGPAVKVATPSALGGLGWPWMILAWSLLEAGVLGLWASAIKDGELGARWSELVNGFRGAPEVVRVAALRWSVGARGVLSPAGLIETTETLFARFEENSDEVVSLVQSGVIDAWAQHSLHVSPLFSEAQAASATLRPLATLWCLGYATLWVGSSRVNDLAALAALPDSAQSDLEACIASGALAFWRNVRFPGSAPALAGPIDAESALVAAGAEPAALNVSAPELDLGEVMESEKRFATLTFVASGARGRVSATLRSTHPGIVLACGNATHAYGGAPIQIGPLWAQRGQSVEVSVEANALPNVDGDGAIEVTATNGVPPVQIPVRWVTRFPSGDLALRSAIGLIGGGSAALAFRGLAGLAMNRVLYAGSYTDSLGVHGTMRAKALDQIDGGDLTAVGILPALVVATLVCVKVYQNKKSTDPNNAASAAFFTFLFAVSCLMTLIGFAITAAFAAVDMVGHRLRAIFGSTMELSQSGLLGWIFTFALLGAASQAAKVLRRQERTNLARVALVAPVALIVLILIT